MANGKLLTVQVIEYVDDRLRGKDVHFIRRVLRYFLEFHEKGREALKRKRNLPARIVLEILSRIQKVISDYRTHAHVRVLHHLHDLSRATFTTANPLA